MGKAVITIAIRLRYDYDTTEYGYHDAFDYTTEVIELTICVLDSTATYRARLLPFDAIRRQHKKEHVNFSS